MTSSSEFIDDQTVQRSDEDPENFLKLGDILYLLGKHDPKQDKDPLTLVTSQSPTGSTEVSEPQEGSTEASEPQKGSTEESEPQEGSTEASEPQRGLLTLGDLCFLLGQKRPKHDGDPISNGGTVMQDDQGQEYQPIESVAALRDQLGHDAVTLQELRRLVGGEDLTMTEMANLLGRNDPKRDKDPTLATVADLAHLLGMSLKEVRRLLGHGEPAEVAA